MAGAIDLLIDPRPRDLGGFSVRRLLPDARRRNVGPFVFFDHLGPAKFGPGDGIDVRPHPHIGLATVTWLFEGALDHRDSLGTVQTIRPGAVNWMTAGKGISHSERTPPDERKRGHRIEAIQTWVALPKSHEEVDPAFAHFPADKLPKASLGGATATIIAGSAFGQTSPVPFPSGICQVVIEAEQECSFETPEMQECCVHVVSGEAKVDGQTIGECQMVVLPDGQPASVELSAGTRIMIAGGDTLDAPRHLDWNFVSSSKERLAKAREDWRASICAAFKDSWFTQPPGEVAYIPYPSDPDPDPEDVPPL